MKSNINYIEYEIVMTMERYIVTKDILPCGIYDLIKDFKDVSKGTYIELYTIQHVCVVRIYFEDHTSRDYSYESRKHLINSDYVTLLTPEHICANIENNQTPYTNKFWEDMLIQEI